MLQVFIAIIVLMFLSLFALMSLPALREGKPSDNSGANGHHIAE